MSPEQGQTFFVRVGTKLSVSITNTAGYLFYTIFWTIPNLPSQ